MLILKISTDVVFGTGTGTTDEKIYCHLFKKYIRLDFKILQTQIWTRHATGMAPTAPASCSDSSPGTVLGRRTRQQARDDMYDALAQLSRENCEINKNNTSHEYHRLKRAAHGRGWTALAWA